MDERVSERVSRIFRLDRLIETNLIAFTYISAFSGLAHT